MDDAKEVQVLVRIPAALAKHLEACRRYATDLPFRPEVIRRLTDRALPNKA